jgi:parallel beta-helix repeat protein
MSFSGLFNFTTFNSNGTAVFGPIDTDTIWNPIGSPYLVMDHITVNDGVTLTIEPGVEVIFNGAYSILVDGNITSVGSSSKWINITSNQATPAMGQWNTIEVNPPGHAEVRYTNISGATIALSLESHNNNVTNCTFWNNGYAIELYSSWNNNISQNNIWNNSYGIYTYNSMYNNITKNKVTSNNIFGIRLWSSHDNYIKENEVSNNRWGIYFYQSSRENLTENNFINNGIFLSGGDARSHYIPMNNIVNGKPLFYLKDITGFVLDGIPIGQLVLANCTDGMVQNLEINYTDAGCEIVGSRNITLQGNHLSYNNINGIAVFSSSNMNITDNTVQWNKDYGIRIESFRNEIVGNNVSYNSRTGIRLYVADNTNITGNDILENKWHGIFIDSSSNCRVIDNKIWNNEMEGLGLDAAPNSNISNNNFIKNGILITGNQLSDYNTHDIPTNNIVNGKPLYYYKDMSGLVIDSIPIGQLILANCDNFIIMNLQIEYTDAGSEIAFSSDISITNVNMLNNDYGFYFYSSSEIEISNCNVSYNERGINVLSSSYFNIINSVFLDNWYAVILSSSDNNQVFHNNFLNSTKQVYDNGNDNSWDNGYQKGGN